MIKMSCNEKEQLEVSKTIFPFLLLGYIRYIAGLSV